MCDLLWTKSISFSPSSLNAGYNSNSNKGKNSAKEILDKFHIVSCIPKLDELLEHDFIVGAILRILNYQKREKK
jgi:hypothetical protein